MGLRELGIDLWMPILGTLFTSFRLRQILVDHILKAQFKDPYLMRMKRKAN